MASGNTLVVLLPTHCEPPSSGFAAFSTRNNHPTINFDAGTDESMIFKAVLPRHYSGQGVTVTLYWCALAATSGNCVWMTAFERIADETLDIDSDSFAANNSATAAAPSTSGFIQYTTIAHTDGGEMDSLAAGELFRIRVTRDADNGSDNMSSDAQLVALEIRET